MYVCIYIHTYTHTHTHTHAHTHIHTHTHTLYCYLADHRNTHGNTHRSPPNDSEFEAIEAAFRMELMLSVGAISFQIDEDTRKSA